jgi:hypothetical protein
MADDGVAGAGGWLADQVSLGVLAASVPRDAVDDAVAAAGRQARRSDGKLPPHVMAYFAMAMALFADDDYEEVAARLSGTLGSWGCWDPRWDAPDTAENAAAFGYAGTGDGGRAAFPKARVVTVSECASHAVVDAEIGGVAGKGAGEQSLARPMYGRLEEDWLLLADRNFHNWADWCLAADSGAALLWRVKSDLRLPVLQILPDGSYRSVLVSPDVRGKGSLSSFLCMQG